jgi:hypothetical protein
VDESFVVVSREQILRRIRGEYIEMPGLRLTGAQARRLWGLDEQTCAQLLEMLTGDRFLYRNADGTYARFADEAVPFSPLRMAKATGSPPSTASPSRLTSRRGQ